VDVFGFLSALWTKPKRNCCVFGMAALIWSPQADAADILAGPSYPLKTLAAAVNAAQAGDRILLEAGVYADDVATTGVPLTIEGLGSGAVLRISKPISNRKAIIVTNASLTVRNLTFEGAHVLDSDGRNGAGIRGQAGNLTVEDCRFLNNQNGILFNPNPTAAVTVARSTFTGNGAGDGFSHGMYINEVAQFTVRDSVILATRVGHGIKSRALRTTIVNTAIDDGVNGTTSYAIDLSNGGVVVLDGVQITQGQNSQNPTMIAYGAEGNLKTENALSITNSTFVNRMQGAVIAVNNFASGVSAALANNSFENVPTSLRGLGQSTTSAVAVVRQPAVFSTAQTAMQSHLRFYNAGATSGTVRVTLYDSVTGNSLARWTSPAIPPGAAPQYAIGTIENAAIAPFVKPPIYAVGIEANFPGSFQHVLYKPADGTLTNLSSCDTGISMNTGRLTNVHTSLLDNGFPSAVVIYNTSTTARAVTLAILDARNGTRLGAYTTPTIAPGGQGLIAVAAMEAGARITPQAGMFHYNLQVESQFSGVLQQLVNNQRAGVVTDMTPICALAGT
jgi:hypothetical protein